MVYPSKSGLDAWEALGNPGWNWSAMAPYYRKFHTLNMPSDKTCKSLALDYLDSDVQGVNGPIQASFTEDEGPGGSFSSVWVETFKNLNLKVSRDLLSGSGAGGFANPSSIEPKRRIRSYAGNAYYSPEVAARPNLKVITKATVTKINFSSGTGADIDAICATGVQYTDNGREEKTLCARYEVILAAGTFQSPQLLELSGIGTQDLLTRLGISTVIDNPFVGESLQDHGFVPQSFEVNDDVPTADQMQRNPELGRAAVAEYEASHSGPLAAGAASSAFMPLVDFLSAEGRRKQAQLFDTHLEPEASTVSSSQKLQDDLVRRILESPEDASAQYAAGPLQMNVDAGPATKDIFSAKTEGNYLSITSALNHPLSRGSVHIRTANAKDKPVLDFRYLSHPLDLEIQARHVQYVDTIKRTEPLASIIKKNGRRIPLNVDTTNLEIAKEVVRNGLISNYHPVGTCAMMTRELGGVVNDRLIVHGTKNLRVVDASIMPLIPRGNIQSSVYAVAERAADLIKADLKKSFKSGIEE